LIGAGADRVIAMQAPVTDDYATVLAAVLYRELARFPNQTVATALARARRQAEKRPSERDAARRPEFGLATLFTAGEDPPLIDTSSASAPLAGAQAMPSGTSVRELSVGQLIGRRRQLREATAVLRRSPAARDEHGAIAGIQLLGIGGIGKTAIAGRVITRLLDDGMLVAVHEGRWNPTTLFAAIARVLRAAEASDPVAEALVSTAVEDTCKADYIRELLARVPLLLVFDDFEHNLTPGGAAFADPGFGELLTDWCEAAEAGAVLITCRYPLPDDDRYLIRIPVPPMSPAELRRLFLRLPALRNLPAEDERLLVRMIGGHPRLIEYVDALIRGKPTQLKSVQAKLRDLARRERIDLRRARAVDAAITDTLLLGSADILLEELLGLLTDHERAILDQLSVCRAPMTLPELADTLTPDPEPPSPPALEGLQGEVEHLVELTLLSPGPGILVHPWTAEILNRRASGDQHELHRRALTTRLRRFERHTAEYHDLVEVPRHLAALGQYDDAATVAGQAATMLPGALSVSAFLADIRPLIPPSESAWFDIAKREYEALRAAGRLTAAHSLLQRMHHHVRRNAAEDPSQSVWVAHLSVLLVDLGDLAASTGNLPIAREHYQTALKALDEPLLNHPTNTWWQNRPAVIRNRLGDVARAAGDLNAAAEHYRAGLTIAERLAAADPTNTEWQRDLSISRNRLGDVARAAGDLNAAAEHYRAGLTIRERLAAADPTNTEWQRDLSISRNRLGDVARAAGDLNAAAEHYRAGLTIRERLAAADPTNTEWQRDLSISRDKLINLDQDRISD
jgi:tetratricopeptide (TPR) repeat protein